MSYRYKNKFFSVLGDSISTFEGVSVPKDFSYYTTSRRLEANVIAVSDTWWGRVIENLGGKLLVNNSILGSTVTWHPKYEFQSYGCSDERTAGLDKDDIKPDVIMVYLGINDFGQGVKIIQNSDANEHNLSVFSNAYLTMLEKLKNNYPNAEIWCLTLSESHCSNSKHFQFNYYSCGRHIAEYCNAIRECAKKQGCKIIEQYDNNLSYDTIDGYHPNSDGMQTIASNLLLNIKEFG